MENVDCEDILIFHRLEEDYILDEFLFDDVESSPSNSTMKREAQEGRRTTPPASRYSDEKRPRCLEQMESQEYELTCPSKAGFDCRLERSVMMDGIPTDNRMNNTVAEETSNSITDRAPSLPLRTINSWWKSCKCHRPQKNTWRSFDKRGENGRKRFRQEVHKKLARIEFQSLMLKTCSHHDLQTEGEHLAKRLSRPPKKSLSVTVCCPGTSGMYCKHALIKRLHSKFKIVSKSKEKQVRFILNKDLPENAYLLRWTDFMRVPRVKKRGLNHFDCSEKLGSKSPLSRGLPGFLQGKLWYVINSKNIDFSQAARMMCSPNNLSVYKERAKHRLMEDVIQYMGVLQNYPELSWLPLSKKRTGSLAEEADWLDFTKSHRSFGQSSSTLVCSQLNGCRGRLRCSDRYFLKRQFYKFQEWLNDPYFISNSIVKSLNGDSTRVNSAKSTQAGLKNSRLVSMSKYPSNRSKIHEIEKRVRHSSRLTTVDGDCRGGLTSYQSSSDEQEKETDTELNRAKFFAKHSAVSPSARKVSRVESPCSCDRYSLKASCCSSRRESVESDFSLRSFNDGKSAHKNHRAFKRARSPPRNTKVVSYLQRYATSEVYRRPKRLEIPAECNPRRRSLYENVFNDNVYRVPCRSDPRLTAPKRGDTPMTELCNSVKCKAELDAAKCAQNTLFPSKPISESISLLTESPVIDLQNCRDETHRIHGMSNVVKNKSDHPSFLLHFPHKERHSDDVVIEKDNKEAWVRLMCDNGFCVGTSPQKPECLCQDFHQNVHDYCLKSDMPKSSLHVGGIQKPFPRVKEPLRISHPSIRACLTKKDTLELLDELCDVVQPLSPLARDDEISHTLHASLSFGEDLVGTTPEHAPFLNKKDPFPSLINGTDVDDDLQDAKLSGVPARPMQCTQAIQCRPCEVKFVKLSNSSHLLSIYVAADTAQREITNLQELFSLNNLGPNRESCNETNLTLLGHDTSLNQTMNTKTDEKSIENDLDSLHQEKSLNAQSSPFDHTGSQKPSMGRGGSFNLGAQELVDNSDSTEKLPQLQCKMHYACATSEEHLSVLNGKFAEHLFIKKVNSVLSTHLLETPLNVANQLLVYQHSSGSYGNLNQAANNRDCEGLNHKCEVPFDASNNHGDRPEEEEFPGKQPIFKDVERPEGILPERPVAAVVNLEQDYICDNMSLPIVLSASDRVYHVSANSYEQVNRTPFYEMPSAKSVSQRETNLDSTMVGGSCDIFLNDMLHGHQACQTFPTQHDEIGPNEDPDLLSKAMETAGLTDREIETFLASESSLDVFFGDESEFNLDAFLSSPPECSKQTARQQTEQPEHFSLDFYNENADNHETETSSIMSQSCSKESNRNENIEEATPHIHLDTSPAMNAFSDTPTFKLGPRNGKGPQADPSEEVFCAGPGIHSNPAVDQRCACNISHVYELNEGTDPKRVDVSMEESDFTSPDHEQSIHFLNTEPLFTYAEEEDTRFKVSRKSTHSTTELTGCLEDFCSSSSSKEICRCGEKEKANCFCIENMPETEVVMAQSQSLPGSQNSHYMPFDFESRPEILDLQPLSFKHFEKEASEQEEEEEEEEDGGEKGGEKLKEIRAGQDLPNPKKTEAFGEDIQQRGNDHGIKPVVSNSVHPNSYFGSSSHRKMMRLCMEREAHSCGGNSQPVSPSYLHPEESELCPESTMPNPKSLVKARSIIRCEKNPASKIGKGKRETHRGRVEVGKGGKKNHVQSKKGCKNSLALKRKKAVKKQKKVRRQTIISERNSSKSNLNSKTKMGSAQSSVSDSPNKVEKLARTRTRESRPIENVLKSDKPCNRTMLQTGVKDCQQKPSGPFDLDTRLAEAHFEYESSRADVFSQQLSMISPGFLKSVSQEEIADFLKSPIRKNKITTKFPRPLVSSRRPSATSQKIWRSRKSHNQNNNSMERIKPATFPIRTILEKSLIVGVVKTERGKMAGETIAYVARLNYPEDEKHLPASSKSNITLIPDRSRLNNETQTPESKYAFRGGVRERAKYALKNSMSARTLKLIPNYRKFIQVVPGEEREVRRLDNYKKDSNETVSPNITINKTSDRKEMSIAANSFSNFYFPTPSNFNNNSSNEQDHRGLIDDESETKKKHEQKERNTLSANSSLNRQMPSQLKKGIPEYTIDSAHQKEEKKCELPRIGQNMQNFHAARRKLKEMNARLTKIHGKQDVCVASTSAPVFSKFLNNKELLGRRGEPHSGHLGSTQTLQWIGNGQRRGGLSQRSSLNNIPGVNQTGRIKYPETGRAVNAKVKGTSSSPKTQNVRQRCPFGVPTIPKLHGSLQSDKMNDKERALLSEKIHIERTEIGDTVSGMKENSNGTLLSGQRNKVGTTSLSETRSAENLDRDMDSGLARFVERLNSGYGQQLTKGNQEEQARLENLCSRYMNTLKMQKSLQNKLTVSPAAKLDRGNIQAPLGLKDIADYQSILQQRKRKSSYMGELYKNPSVLGKRENSNASQECVGSMGKNMNENMKMPAKSGALEKEHNNIVLSKNSIFGNKRSGVQCDKKKSENKLSLSGGSPRRWSLQVPVRKESSVVLKNVSHRQSARAKSALQLRPDLKESANRLSSHRHSSVERLQYDISTWETKFGKSFHLGLFDMHTAESGGQKVVRPPSSSNVIHSPRLGRQGSSRGLITSPTRLRNIDARSATKKRTLPNSKRISTPKTEGDQMKREEKINTFFGSLLNLIDQKEKQKNKLVESCTEAESKQNKPPQKESHKEKLNKLHLEGAQDKDKQVHREESAKKESKEGEKRSGAISSVGRMYRNMIETIKAKRSSFVEDPDAPWVIPPFQDFEDMSQSPESMLNLPNYSPEPGAKSTAADRTSLGESAGSVGKKPHALIKKRSGGADDSKTDGPVPKLSTRGGKQAMALGKKLPALRAKSRSAPNTTQREDTKSVEAVNTPELKVCKTESTDAKSPLDKNDDIANNDSTPIRRNEEPSLTVCTTTSSLHSTETATATNLQLPKLEHKFCVEMKPPPASAVSAVSDSTTTICLSRGGGDSVDQKDGALQMSADNSPNVSFASELAIPVDVLGKEQNLKKHTSKEAFNVSFESISPQVEEFAKSQPEQLSFVKTGSPLSPFVKDEKVSWTELHDIKKLDLEAPLYKNRPIRAKETDKTGTIRFEPHNDKLKDHESSRDKLRRSPVRERFMGSDCRGSGMNRSPIRNIEPNTKCAVETQDDKALTGWEFATSFEKRDVFETENAFSCVNSDSFTHSTDRISTQGSTFPPYHNRVSRKPQDFDTSRCELEIDPTDALEQQAEQDLGTTTYRRSYCDADKQQYYRPQHRYGDTYSWRQSHYNRQADSAGTYSRQCQVTSRSNSTYCHHTDHQNFQHHTVGGSTPREDFRWHTTSQPDSENSVKFPSSNLSSYSSYKASDGDLRKYSGSAADPGLLSSRSTIPLRPEYSSTSYVTGDTADRNLCSPRGSKEQRSDHTSTQRTGVDRTDDLNSFSPRSTIPQSRPEYTSTLTATGSIADPNRFSPRSTIPQSRPEYSSNLSENVDIADPNRFSLKSTIPQPRPEYSSNLTATGNIADPNRFSSRSTIPPPRSNYMSTLGTTDPMKSEIPYDTTSRGESMDQYSTDIPWDQFASSQVIPLNNQSCTTMYDPTRRSLGHSYLTPIQEESEEDQ